MSIENNRKIVYGSPLGGELFSFFNVGKDSNNRYNWGALPQSEYINPKSKRKPVFFNENTIEVVNGKVFSKQTELSDSMFRKVNYGHNFKSYSNPLSAIKDVVKNENFPYIRPQNWFRPADFWDYDHEQGDWFPYYTDKTRLEVGSTARVVFDSSEMGGEGILELLTFGAMTGITAQSVNLGFIMVNNAPFNENQAQVYFYSCTDMTVPEHQLDLVLSSANGLTITANASKNLGVGEWRMYPCLTTANFAKDSMTYFREETANGTWYPIPYSNIHILSIVSPGQGGGDQWLEYITYDGVVENDINVVDAASLTYSISKLSVAFSNSNEGSTYEVDYTWSIRGVLNQVNVPSKSGSFTLGPDRQEEVILIEAKDESSRYRFSVGETPVTLTLTYSVTGDLNTETESIEIELT